MEKWEYLVLRDVDDRDLNLYGIDGWELVTALKVNMQAVYYFKRPLDENESEHIGAMPETGFAR